MKLGFLYAGQGSQHPGMGADLYEAYPAFRQVLDAAQAEVDFDLRRTSFEDPEGVLNQTRYTQPCMVAFAAGLTAVLREKGIVPAVAAGLSLGEYSALHAAGVFDAKTAVRLAAFRGKAMEEAAKGHDSAMTAVLGLDREPLQKACEAAADLGTVVIANSNDQLPRPAGHWRGQGGGGEGRVPGEGTGREALSPPDGQRPLPYAFDEARRGGAGEVFPERAL